MAFDLKRNYDFEWLPTTVLSNIKYTYLAKKKRWSHLPQFLDFRRVDSEVKLIVSKMPIRLRDVLSDREKVEKKGSLLIKGILTALKSL